MASNSTTEEFFDVTSEGYSELDLQYKKADTNNGHVPYKEGEDTNFLLSELAKTGILKERRKELAIPRSRGSFGLWSFLKHFLGRDLTRVTMPVHFNEPLSFTQRIVEDIEYSDLLDKATGTSDSCLRLAYLATFASSCWVCTLSRYGKPFNPLLGETFEYIRPDLGYYCVTEQVSHHPPITAMHVESEKWAFWQEYKLDIKFRGQWATVAPTGLLHFKSKIDGRHYYWNKPATTIHNLIFGGLWADHDGEVVVRCTGTEECAKVRFTPYSSAGRKYKELSGSVYNSDGNLAMNLRGAWHTHMEYKAAGEENGEWVRMWVANPQIKNWERQFGFTHFSMTLNEPDPSILCPTDSRKRPDQRFLEENKVDISADEKHRLEEKQRAARRKREESGEIWKPRWFDLTEDPEIGVTYHKFNHKYWIAKLTNNYSECSDIY